VTPSAAVLARPHHERAAEVLSGDALTFVAELHHNFEARRQQLLHRRQDRHRVAAETGHLDFLSETRDVRIDQSWKVAPPVELVDRRVEITGPTDAKMLINALNSGARVFMADFEDANSPTFDNMVQGQLNLTDAIERRIRFISPDGREYQLKDHIATLMPRPRGWHLSEKHVAVDGARVSAALFDFGLYFFHNARRLVDRASHVYLYLPKLESRLEARLWNDVFAYAERAMSIPYGCIRATALIETVPAAFEMEEILFELRDHSYGLNAGRWDYLFSMIKTFGNRPEYLLPDRNSVTMTAPFMRAYTSQLVHVCHKRGAFAIGGMAAYIPNRQDQDANSAALARVRDDKLREVSDGFDGTWVAHPDLVPVAMDVFDEVLGSKPNQIDQIREAQVQAEDLLDVSSTPGQVTEGGLRNNIAVGLQYLDSWLRGNGAAAINNLMEDVATAEISRCQVWQWLHAPATMPDGKQLELAEVRRLIETIYQELRQARMRDGHDVHRLDDALRLFNEVALSDPFVEFLTYPAYECL
jgi:malate synthase